MTDEEQGFASYDPNKALDHLPAEAQRQVRHVQRADGLWFTIVGSLPPEIERRLADGEAS